MTIRNPITARRLQVLQLVLRDPAGITSRDLADALKITQTSALEHLRKLRKLELVGPEADGGRGTRWLCFVPAQQLRAATRQATRAERSRMRKAALAEAFESGPVRRVVSAADCLPVRTRAPASVFLLAA